MIKVPVEIQARPSRKDSVYAPQYWKFGVGSFSIEMRVRFPSPAPSFWLRDLRENFSKSNNKSNNSRAFLRGSQGADLSEKWLRGGDKPIKTRSCIP